MDMPDAWSISQSTLAGGTLLIGILSSTDCITRCGTDKLIDHDCLSDNPVGPEVLWNTRLDGVLTPAKLHQPSAPYDLGIGDATIQGWGRQRRLLVFFTGFEKRVENWTEQDSIDLEW